jgi:molybdate transport system ATP-binding protein
VAEVGLTVEVRQRLPVRLDASFGCAPGELTALVGPSGSGKTTLLRVIAGLARPAAGRVASDGRVWFDAAAGIDLPPQARRIGMVFQTYALFPHLTALENVMAPLGALPLAERRARAAALLERMNLAGLEARLPRQLSGGQQQRVAVARALAREPEVLLLDEPFSAVDQVTRRKLQRELARLRETLNIPVVLVTHDLDEARLLAGRIVLVHHGTTLQSGTPDEVLLRPRSGEVARLSGLYNQYEGIIAGPLPGGGARLRWRGYALEVARAQGFGEGDRVDWVVPSQFVLLHRRDRPSHGERENPVSGVCSECMLLGDAAQVSMAIDDDPRVLLSFSVPAHVAQRNGLAAGERLTVSLLAEGIHLMRPAG